jgi:hypothetical protein
MKVRFFCLFLAGWACASQAQISSSSSGTITLRGSIRAATGTALPFASVALLNAKDSSLVKGGLSNETGVYELTHIKAGRYLVAASMVGYKTMHSAAFEVNTASKEVPSLLMTEAAKNLNEVTVVAKKPLFEQQVDRMVVNVQNSITAAGGTALEVLERSPGITVNRQNGSLAMSGKGGVMVMINGKMTRLPMATVVEMLESMTASDIEKIELITTPPARYDAEGDAGIINIVTKKNINFGTNGSLSATMGYGWYGRPSATLNLNRRTKKLNVFGSYTFARDHNWHQYYFNRIVQQKTGPLTTENTSNRYTIRDSHTAKAGFDYALSSQTTLNGLISGFDNRWSGDLPTISFVRQNDVLVSQSSLMTSRANRWKHLMLNLNLRHVFKNKQEWSFDIDRLYYKNRNPALYFSDIYNVKAGSREQQQFTVLKETPIKTWVLKTDFQQALGAKGRLEAGLKATVTTLDNAVALDRLEGTNWKTDSFYTNRYKLAENILAGYVSLNQSLDTKTKLQAGLRYEYTQTDINTPEGASLVHRRYGNFFPSVFVSRKLTKSQTVNLSYSRRITRPTYDDIAPFVAFFDLNTYASGNPVLLPTISDAVQGSYVLKDTYVFSLKYSYDKNVIAGLQPHINAATNQLYYYAENIDRQNTFSFSVSLPVVFTRWWQSQNNLTGVSQKITTTYQDKPVNMSAYNMQLNSSHTFKLPRKYTAEITGFYQSPAVFGVYRSQAFGQVTVGLQKVLAGDKGTFRLNISDVFWNNVSRWRSNIPSLNLDNNGIFHFEPRVVRLTYNRNFGSKTVKAANNRSTGSEEERKRVLSN